MKISKMIIPIQKNSKIQSFFLSLILCLFVQE
jgi:hypothetical protein